MTDDKILKYRELHHRCRYCKFKHTVKTPIHIGIIYNECSLKDKCLHGSLYGIKGIFCKWYEVNNG